MKTTIQLLFVGILMVFGSCDTSNLDLQDNPNAATPDQAEVEDLYNSIQLSFNDVFNATQLGGSAARMYHAGGNFTYDAWTNPTNFNTLWSAAYNELFPDVETLIAISEPIGFDIHVGSAKVMKAYTMMALVDMLGDVPYVETGKGTDVISPAADAGASVYAAAIVLLDEAIEGLTGSSAVSPQVDIYYEGEISKWITLAKTLKLKAAVTTRLVDPTSAQTINELIAEGDIVDDSSEDFQFNYGSQRANPNSRHWMYNSHYESGDGDYLSNSYMYMLHGEKRDNFGRIYKDPRARYYFYRKVDSSEGQDLTTYACHFSNGPDQRAKPVHFLAIDPNMPYCYGWENGYIGRDHLNGEGLPPDGPIRTSYGLYPGGGQFDWDQYRDTREVGTTGGMGQGISPILLSSYVHFLRAEAALTIGTDDDARELLELGIRASMDKVVGFESLEPEILTTELHIHIKPGAHYFPVNEIFGVTQDRVDEYIDYVLGEYDKADESEKLNILMKEYYIALWGNGLEAYNMYRRTGLPSNIGPSLEPDPGPFPRSFYLPSNYVNRNANREQKSDLTEKVFWDDGSAVLR